MNFKRLLLSFFLLFCVALSAQNKSYSFSSFQIRDEHQRWGNEQHIGAQHAKFSTTEIRVKADKDYTLNIISKTDLPENGVIFLCLDEKANPVTVMLIDNIKMYLYNESNRFLINFDTFASQSLMADTD